MPCCRCVFHQVFQLTTSRRGRRWQSAGFFMTYAISTHDLTKRSTVGFRVWATHRKYFNSRPHEEVDDALRHVVAHIVISTHDLTKRSTFLRCPFWTPFLFQLTTSRRGRPFLPHLAALNCLISTHDLTKRSTFDFLQCCVTVIIISTHDLTKRSTVQVALCLNHGCISTHDLTKRSTGSTAAVLAESVFQLTTSRRGRRTEPPAALSYFHISTHDLTKRSTAICLLVISWKIISTHDLTKRSTRSDAPPPPELYYFNSRPHEEVDNRHLLKGFPLCYFNSRPHEEVDGVAAELQPPALISTHDLTKRSTAVSFIFSKPIFISTHDLTKRSTVGSTAAALVESTFQLTTSRRGRRMPA